MDKEKFKRLFPHLANEIETGVSRVRQRQIEGELEEAKVWERKWTDYDPTVEDFIRRCDTEEEAKEIINYMEKRGEVIPETAEGLRRQLSEEGLRSFGKKKDPGFYDRDR
jgi:hypothetical protein